ncbi:Uncharacterized protein T01_6372, partial [Trichinella spiralis]
LYEQSDSSISTIIFLCFLHVVIRRYVDTLLQLGKVNHFQLEQTDWQTFVSAMVDQFFSNNRFSSCSNRECPTAVISVTLGCVLSCCNMHEQYFYFVIYLGMECEFLRQYFQCKFCETLIVDLFVLLIKLYYLLEIKKAEHFHWLFRPFQSSMEQQSVVGTEKCATGPRNCFKITAVESRVVLPENPTAKRVEKCCSNGIRKMSRFHIVKVLDDPYRRGRWFCKESEDKPSPVVEVDTTKSASELNCTVVNGSGRKFTVCPVILPEEKEKPAKPDVEVPSSRFTVTPVVETTTLKKPAEEFGVQVVGEPSRKFTISAVSTLRDNDALDETQEEEEEEDVVVVAQHRQQDIAFNEKPVTRRSSVPEVLSSPGCATSNSGFAMSSATQNTVATSPTAGRKASCPVPTTPVERNSPHSRPRQPIAIDSKIEQAMNLVKTHLQYAVREEVDELKNRIAHLERQVERLETENRRLRQCEMELQRLQGQRPSHSGKMQ